MLDTQVFDRVLDNDLPTDVLSNYNVYITHVQPDELERARGDRKVKLLECLRRIEPTQLSTATSVWDDTPWDEGSWSDDVTYERMLARLKQLDNSNKKFENQSRDVRIAETALKHGLTLVSDDTNLRTVMTEFGGKAISTMELQKNWKN